MTEVSANDQMLALILDQSQWSEEFPSDLIHSLRIGWAIAWANSISEGHPWLKITRTVAVPIGLEAIRAHSLYGVIKATDPEAAEQIETAAVLPGDEHLYSAVRSEVGGSHVTAMFLSRLVSAQYHGHRLKSEWMAGDIAFEVTGYPGNPEVQLFIKTVSRWWGTYSGKRLPTGGRPSVIEDDAKAISICRELMEEREESWKRSAPSNADFKDRLIARLSLESLSDRTFATWKSRIKSEGKWPRVDRE